MKRLLPLIILPLITLPLLGPSKAFARSVGPDLSIPNIRNYCSDIGWAQKDWKAVSGAPEVMRWCEVFSVKEKSFFGSPQQKRVDIGCPASQPVFAWWGFYPEHWHHHGLVRMHYAQVNSERNRDVFTGVLETNKLGQLEVQIWVWIDCRK